MSDRWGPSEDCKMCGETVSFGSLDAHGLCVDCQSEYRVCDCGEIYERGSMCLTCIEALMK